MMNSGLRLQVLTVDHQRQQFLPTGSHAPRVFTILRRSRRIFCRSMADRPRCSKSSKGHLAQLSAKPAMQYETICFRSRRMRPLVLQISDYGDCGTGRLCREN
ncbi:MAG: hypothetical protein EOR26_26025 [Mesorhizobium sp.]|nr:MAG: hypothetical protein EOR15_17935 [Mesorhizobium sp.]RWJ23112.1 MAG: hypothetical protein EOR26_26025 [Mesorhizobium sp.]RWJ33564.1 MAG: hypothetical protein EOR27_07795 [Mesorhizobium sp.]RWJ78025.1 MAG: hypothetical protein EOR35_23005 [Mesorhizobium sp.]TIR13854.1 MAG: hypothetical protein E5X37_04385 [Mesorhizobium sp.]